MYEKLWVSAVQTMEAAAGSKQKIFLFQCISSACLNISNCNQMLCEQIHLHLKVIQFRRLSNFFYWSIFLQDIQRNLGGSQTPNKEQIAHFRERLAKMGAKDWQSEDQLA